MTITTFDIAGLNAAQLDDLIAAAGKRRAGLEPLISTERPASPVDAVLDPAWFVQPMVMGSLVQIRHPAFGWLSLMIPPKESLTLSDLLRRASEVGEAAKDAPKGR